MCLPSTLEINLLWVWVSQRTDKVQNVLSKDTHCTCCTSNAFHEDSQMAPHIFMHVSAISDLPGKKTVCAFIKHSRYFHYTYNITSIHSCAKKLFFHMLDIIDTAFGYEREVIVCSFLQDFSKGKGSSLHLICNAHIAFLLCGANIGDPVRCHKTAFWEIVENSPNILHIWCLNFSTLFNHNFGCECQRDTFWIIAFKWDHRPIKHDRLKFCISTRQVIPKRLHHDISIIINVCYLYYLYLTIL